MLYYYMLIGFELLKLRNTVSYSVCGNLVAAKVSQAESDQSDKVIKVTGNYI